MSAVGAVALAIGVASLLLAVMLGRGPMAARWPAARGQPLERLRERRRERLAGARALGVLRSTQAGLRSGLPLAPALRSALQDEPAAAVVPFADALRAFELNAPRERTARDRAQRSRDRRLAIALEAIALASLEQLSPARAAAIVGGVADRLLFEQQLADEVRARTSGLRGQIVLLAVLVPALALYLLLTLPGLGETLASPLGRYVLVPLAALLELAGIVASRLLLRSLS